MAAGLYVVDARAPVQRRGEILPRRVTVALCRTPPSHEGRFRDELSDIEGYRRQQAEFGPADSRRHRSERLTTLRNRGPVVFGPLPPMGADRLFAILLDDEGGTVGWGRLRRVAEPDGCEVIRFDSANMRLMSDRFRG